MTAQPIKAQIQNNQTINSPTINGNYNTYTHDQRRYYYTQTKSDRTKEDAALKSAENISQNIIGAIQYFSEENAKTAKSSGDHRLAASIYSKLSKDMLQAGEKGPTYIKARLDLANEQIYFDPVAALDTVKIVHKENPGNIESALALVKINLALGFTDAARTIALSIKHNEKNKLMLENLYDLEQFVFLSHSLDENHPKIMDQIETLKALFAKLDPKHKTIHAENQAFALSTALLSETKNTDKKTFDTKDLSQLLKNYFQDTSDNLLAIRGNGLYIRISTGTVVSVANMNHEDGKVSPLERFDTELGTLLNEIYERSNRIRNAIKNVPKAKNNSIAEKHREIREIRGALAEFSTICNECPSTKYAAIISARYTASLYRSIEDLPAAYANLIDALHIANSIQAINGKTNRITTTKAQILSDVAELRTKMDEGIAPSNPIIPAESPYFSALRQIRELENKEIYNYPNKVFESQLLNDLAIYYDRLENLQKSIEACEASLYISEKILENRIFREDVYDAYQNCKISTIFFISSSLKYQ